MSADSTTPENLDQPDAGALDRDAAALQRHVRFIESLADEMQRSVQEIIPLYEEVLESLADVKVSDYVPIFVCRRVKGILSRARVSS